MMAARLVARKFHPLIPLTVPFKQLQNAQNNNLIPVLTISEGSRGPSESLTHCWRKRKATVRHGEKFRAVCQALDFT